MGSLTMSKYYSLAVLQVVKQEVIQVLARSLAVVQEVRNLPPANSQAAAVVLQAVRLVVVKNRLDLRPVAVTRVYKHFGPNSL